MNKENVNIIVDNSTGEVVDSNVGFRSMWSNPFGFVGQDLSNELEEVFEEISAFAVDPKTGHILNNSSVPVIKACGKVNVHEKIQSFANEVDLYHILEKFAYSDDKTLLNARDCAFGDVSIMPDNINDYCQMVNKQFNKIKSLNPELAKMVIDEKFSAEDIESKANEILKNRVEASKASESEESK